MQNHIHLAAFPDVPTADRAIERLRSAGFDRERISVICPERARPDIDPAEQQSGDDDRTVLPAVAGGSLGAVLGAVTAGVAIVATGGTALLAVGPLLGGTAAGAVTGTFISAMVSHGLEPDLADYYDQELQKGSILVAVEDENEARLRRADQVFRESGAKPTVVPD